MPNKFSSLKSFLKEFEGFEETPYEDENDNLTAGYGANLSDPATHKIMQASAISPEDLSHPKVAESLMDAQLAEKKRILESRIPNANDLPANEQEVLMSLMYNNPKLVGPNLQELVTSGNKEGAAKEILLRSNKSKSGGIAKRRIEEAVNYYGGLPALNMEEEANLRAVVDNIKNPHEKAKVFKRLDELLQSKK